MKAISTIFCTCLGLATVSMAATITQPATAPVRPVTETLWGQKVTDNYRYMESMGAETVAWMKSQGAYTRALMDSIRPRGALARRVAAFTASFVPIQGYAMYGGRAFYEERASGSDNFDLMAGHASSSISPRCVPPMAASRTPSTIFWPLLMAPKSR